MKTKRNQTEPNFSDVENTNQMTKHINRQDSIKKIDCANIL